MRNISTEKVEMVASLLGVDISHLDDSELSSIINKINKGSQVNPECRSLQFNHREIVKGYQHQESDDGKIKLVDESGKCLRARIFPSSLTTSLFLDSNFNKLEFGDSIELALAPESNSLKCIEF